MRSYVIFYAFLIQFKRGGMNKQKRNKPRYNQQFKTFNSQQSCIDVFSRVQTLFLQKFFKYNLTDYFSDTLTNIEDDLFIKKIKNKQIKQLASETFLTKASLKVSTFAQNLNQFYSYHHQNQNAEFSHNFKHLYSSTAGVDGIDIEERQLMMVHVKMRAQIEKIENLPDEIAKELEMCQKQAQILIEKEEEEFFHYLKQYKKNVINIFVVYFGDINFQIFNKEKYVTTTINFFNSQVQLKYYVFYVSRISLIEKFKKINKIDNIQYINDLLIQLYDFKRQKHKSKKLKNNNKQKAIKISQQQHKWFRIFNIFKWVSIFSITTLTLGFIFLKLYF